MSSTSRIGFSSGIHAAPSVASLGRANREGGALVERALGPGPAAVPLDDPAHVGQPDAGSLESSIRCSRWKTPNSLSTYSMSKPTPLSRTKKIDLPIRRGRQPISMRASVAGPRVLDRVGEQVLEHQPDQHRVGRHGRAGRRHSSRSAGRSASCVSLLPDLVDQ